MSDCLIGFRSSPSQPLAYARLSLQDAEALSRFVETNARPDVITCGTAPTFALAEHIRAAPSTMTRAGRTLLATQWIRNHGVPLEAWATWSVDLLPADSDYNDPPHARG